jgi:hypothetical protein
LIPSENETSEDKESKKPSESSVNEDEKGQLLYPQQSSFHNIRSPVTELGMLRNTAAGFFKKMPENMREKERKRDEQFV